MNRNSHLASATRAAAVACAAALTACSGSGGGGGGGAAPELRGARVITAASAAADLFDPALEGSAALGRIGDIAMANARIRLVIQSEGRDEGPSPFFGTIIDAGTRDAAGAPGMDAFGEMTPFFQLGMACRATEVLIEDAGGENETAVVLARGVGDVVDVPDLPGIFYTLFRTLGSPFGPLLESLILDGLDGGGPGQGLAFFLPDLDRVRVGCETRYELAPGDSFVTVTTTLRNLSNEELVTPPGDLIDSGGDVEWFIPASASRASQGFGEQFVTAFEWAGLFARGVSYGYVPEHQENILITAAGVGGLASGSTDGADLFFPEPATSPYLRIPAGGSGSWMRRLVVGSGSISSVSDVVYDLAGAATGLLRGTVREAGGGAPLPGVRITALLDLPAEPGVEPGHPITQFLSDAEGRFEGRLPPGSYGLVAADAFDFKSDTRPALVEPEVVSIAAGETTEHDLTLGRTGTLRIEVREALPGGGSAPIPGRVTFVGLDPTPKLSSVLDNANDPLVRGVAAVYFLTGEDRSVQVEPGAYEVFVTHGPEYSLFRAPITIGEGDNGTLRAEIARVVDTEGWLGGEFHVHSVNSPDSPVSTQDRLREFVADHVELITATDHDVVTDYAPLIAELGLSSWIVSMPGLEITPFAYGHYNAWPLVRDASGRTGGAITHGDLDTLPAACGGGGAPDARRGDMDGVTPAQIFDCLDAVNPGAQVRMVNHPRSSFQGYFDATAIDFRDLSSVVDPTRIRLPAGAALFTPGSFTAMEIQNGTSLGSYSTILNDWMALLHRGERIAGMSVSDTHKEVRDVGGWGRSYVPVEGDDPAALSALGDAQTAAFRDAFARAINAQRVTGSLGLFVTAELADDDPVPSAEAVAGLGETLSTTTPGGALDGTATLRIRVQAPDWADYDRIVVFVNTPARANPLGSLSPGTPDALGPTVTLDLGAGFTRTLVPVPGTGASRFETEVSVPISVARDAWILVDVRGTSGKARAMFPALPQAEFGPAATLADILAAIAKPVGAGGVPGGVLAHGFTNPIYLDADGDGVATPIGPSAILAPAAAPPRSVAGLREIPAMDRAEAARALVDLAR